MEEPGRLKGRVLLTGASGFIGGAVLKRWGLAARPALRLLIHKSSQALSLPPNCDLVQADLARPKTLNGICRDVDTVLHLAAYLGNDPDLCDTVNGRGTEALVERARESGVKRVIYLSSAGVYGYAVHRNAKETEVTPQPVTPISRSRVRAERAVLGCDGLVLRPLFVYGSGDTHFLPVLLRALHRFPFLVDGGRARVSVVAVDDLAAVLVALATEDWTEKHRGVFHVNDGRPERLQDIARALSRCLGSACPSFSVPFFVAHGLLQLSGGNIFQAAGRESIKHRLFLVSRDHYYDAAKLWDLVSVRPGPPLAERLLQYLDWYRRFVPKKSQEGGA